MSFASKAISLVSIALFAIAQTQAKDSTQAAYEFSLSNQQLMELVARHKPKKYTYIKDTPILVYPITTDRFEDIPAEIRNHLGEIDHTGYTREDLRKRIGSVIALQMDDGKPDFYIMDIKSFRTRYSRALLTKNSHYLSELQKILPSSMTQGGLLSVIKTAPAQMIKLSELGLPKNATLKIESDWSQPQIKPAGHDGYLIWNEDAKRYYLENTAEDGHPIGYVLKTPISCLKRALAIALAPR